MSNKSIFFVAFLAAVLPFKAAAQGGFGAWGGWGGFAPCAVCIMYPALCAATDNLCCGKVFMCQQLGHKLPVDKWRRLFLHQQYSHCERKLLRRLVQLR
jgi:hypothetical protein